MFTLNELEQKLVDALTSGEYKQVRLQLRDEEGFCCLGVACDLSGLGTWDNEARPNTYVTVGFDGEHEFDFSLLPLVVMEKLGWVSPDGMLTVKDRDNYHPALSDLNDWGFTFPQIADLIRAGFVKRKGEA